MALRRSLVAVILGTGLAVGGSLWYTVSVEREKRDIQQTVVQLQSEQARLNQELSEAQATIESQRGELGTLAGELDGVKARLEHVGGELASLQREYERLQGDYHVVGGELQVIHEEKRQLEAKLSSLKELRVAIRDVKRKMRQERLAAWRTQIEAFRKEDHEQLVSGNRGYVVRDGLSTIGSRSRLHVHVLDPELK